MFNDCGVMTRIFSFALLLIPAFGLAPPQFKKNSVVYVDLTLLTDVGTHSAIKRICCM